MKDFFLGGGSFFFVGVEFFSVGSVLSVAATPVCGITQPSSRITITDVLTLKFIDFHDDIPSSSISSIEKVSKSIKQASKILTL